MQHIRTIEENQIGGVLASFGNDKSNTKTEIDRIDVILAEF